MRRNKADADRVTCERNVGCASQTGPFVKFEMA